ncbi:MAG: hypothetical protein AB1489_41510 [Acidobacteriota bacterium]
MPMDLPESYEFTQQQFHRVNCIYEVMERHVYPIIEREIDAQESLQEWDREPTFLGLFLRALTWVKSIDKLDEPTDLQPILTSVRALLETSVDLNLLRAEPGTTLCWKMYWWEESAKLKAATCLRDYYKRALPRDGKNFPADIPSVSADAMQFIDNNEAHLLNQRRTLWPSHVSNSGAPKHPERWTGSGELLTDVRAADRAGGSLIKTIVGMPLEEFYESEYRRLSWNVHGSGLTIVRRLTPSGVHLMCGFGYLCCARLALLCTKLVVDEFGVANEISIIQKVIDGIAADQADENNNSNSAANS